MKNITIIAERASDQALAAVLPPEGVASITISRHRSPNREDGARRTVHAFRNPARFNPVVRIDLVVEDAAADAVFDGLSFAYGAGIFSDAEAWIAEPAQALAA